MKTPHEIPMKQWVAEMAASEGVTPCTIWYRMKVGTMKRPPVRRVNKRIVFVQIKPVKTTEQIRREIMRRKRNACDMAGNAEDEWQRLGAKWVLLELADLLRWIDGK